MVDQAAISEVSVWTEVLEAIVFRGEERLCKAMARSIVGKPLTMPCESGAVLQVGTVVSAVAFPVSVSDEQ